MKLNFKPFWIEFLSVGPIVIFRHGLIISPCPFTSITLNGQLNNDSVESLKKDWDLYCQALDTLKISQIIRKVIVIEVSEEDTLIGTYQTQMFAGDRRVMGPYTSSAMLNHDGKTWRISSIMNALGHRDWTTREYLT